MQVQNDIKDARPCKAFKDLEIGDVYFDNCGILNIKTTERMGCTNIIFFNEDTQVWDHGVESGDAFVFPIRATLTLEAYL